MLAKLHIIQRHIGIEVPERLLHSTALGITLWCLTLRQTVLDENDNSCENDKLWPRSHSNHCPWKKSRGTVLSSESHGIREAMCYH